MIEREFYGNEAQRAMQMRAFALWTLLRDDSRFSYGGRAVAQDGVTTSDLANVAAFAELQGATGAFFIAPEREAELLAGLADRGLGTDRWDQLMGGADTIEACRALLADQHLPAGMRYADLVPETSKAVREDFAATALACGVLPPAPAALMGLTRQGYATMILDREGRVAATAGSVMQNHPDSPFGDAAWWGMLATREDCRGLGLARLLGARAVVTMAKRYGTRRFYSGVRTDNIPSQRLCRGIGIGDSGYVSIAAMAPGFGQFTK